MSYQYSCTICGCGGHSASCCKELASPLPDEFYKPSGTIQEHQHDEDCEDKLVQMHLLEIVYCYKKWYQKVLKTRSKRLS